VLKALKLSVNEGEACVSAVQHHGETTLEHTGKDGQLELHRKMEAAREEWREATESLDELMSQLESQLQAWTEHDGCCEELSRWLTEMEIQLKNNVEMKSTVADKQAVVAQLCVSLCDF